MDMQVAMMNFMGVTLQCDGSSILYAPARE